jgi:hypothetical protein
MAYKKLKHILHDNKQNTLHKRQHIIAKQLRQKFNRNNVTVTTADKSKISVIIYTHELKEKITSFLETNQFKEIKNDPTEKHQKTMRKILNQSNQIIHKNRIRMLLPQKPTAPQLQIRLKTHKENYPIRPVVNNINAPTYKVASFLNKILLDLIQLRNTYNVQNSAQLASDLTAIKIHEHHRCVTLDIKYLFTNLPITEILNITKHLLQYNNAPELTTTQCVTLLQNILDQNYFTYDDKIYICTKGVAMGSPIASTVAEIFLQHQEHRIIKQWMEDPALLYYSRYVDDILIIYDTRYTTADTILAHMNRTHKNIQFKLTTEYNDCITSWI